MHQVEVGDEPVHHLVHPRLSPQVGGIHRQLEAPRQIAQDRHAFGQDKVVIHQNRNRSVGVEGKKGGAAVFAKMQADRDLVDRQSVVMDKQQHGTGRGGQGVGIKFHGDTFRGHARALLPLCLTG